MHRLVGRKHKNFMESKKKYPILLSDVTQAANPSFIRGYRRFWPFMRKYALLAVIGMLLTIPIGALDAVVASFLRPFMDKVMVEQNKDFAYTVPLIILGFALGQGILIYIAAVVNSFVGGRISRDMKMKLFDKLLQMDTSFYDRNNTGTINFRFANDVDLAASGLMDNLKLFLTKFFSSMSLIGVLLYNSWQLSIAALGMLVFLIWPMAAVRRRIKKIMNDYVRVGTQVVTLYNETIDGCRIIKSFNLISYMNRRFDNVVQYIFRLNMKMVRDTNWLVPAMHLVTAIGVASVLYFGMTLILDKVITPGAFVAFLSALIMLYTPIKSIGKNYINVQKSLLALDRIYELLGVSSYEGDNEYGKKDLDGIHHDITFSHVNFRYTGDGPEVLHDISFTVKAGTKVALVGNSGGGKSTVCSLIPRLYEIDGGEISIDGEDIRNFKLASLRHNMAMVFQDNFLFEGTVRDNLLLGKRDATEDEIKKAVKSAYLDEFLGKLDHGLDSEIGERGTKLSGGQKQRLAIARAVIKNAPLVILDEATSALDNKSEKVVQKALDELMKGRTTIVIAHRLSTIMDADEILVINDGRIVEHGRHEELLARDGAYAALYRSQFSKKKKHGSEETDAGKDSEAAMDKSVKVHEDKSENSSSLFKA